MNNFRNINEIVEIRYLWAMNPCCPAAYKGVPGFQCEEKNCGLYTTISDKPLPPFKYAIENNKCVVL